VLFENGFKLNSNKFRFQHASFKQEVTGIKVNQKVNVDRKYIRRLRAILHNLESKGALNVICDFYGVTDKPSSKQARKFFFSIEGQINHIGFVRGKDDSIYLRLKHKFNKLTASVPYR